MVEGAVLVSTGVRTSEAYAWVIDGAKLAHHPLFGYNLTQAWRVAVFVIGTQHWPGFKRGAQMDTDRMLSLAIGLLSGSLVGAAAVFLFTPQSGSDLRQNVAAKYQDVLESGKQAIADRRQTLEAEYKARIQIPLHSLEE